MSEPVNADLIDIEIVVGVEEDDLDELIDRYSFAIEHRERFLLGEIPFDTYIDGLAENGITVDEYLDICINNFQEVGIIQ